MATFRPRESGRYQAVIRKKGVSVSQTFRTKDMAKRWAKRIEDEIDMGIYNHHGREHVNLLSDLIERYIKEITPRKKSWRVEKYSLGTMSKYFKGVFTDELTSEKILRFIDSRIRAGIKSATINKEINKLSHVIDTGVALWGVNIHHNPVKSAKRILHATRTLDTPQSRDRRLFPEEEAILLASRIGRVVEFALETAMRRGEIVKARPAHIRGNTLYIGETKTNKPRTIPLSVRAKNLLRQTEHGFGFSGQVITAAFAKCCKANGVEDLRFHDLRHEAASRFFEKGLSIEEVAIITGHSDWRSLKRYTHLRPEDLAKKL